jgi:PilX N-terminal
MVLKRALRADSADSAVRGSRPSRSSSSPAGAALPLAIVALLVVSVLVSAAFLVSRQEQLVGRSTMRSQQAFGAAEAGMHVQLGDWAATGSNDLAAGDSVSFEGPVGGSGWYRGSIRRLNDLLYLVRSEGFSADSTARQQVGMVLRRRPIELDISAALKTLDVRDLSGSSLIDGNDHLPPSWTGCPPPSVALPGLQLPSVGQLSALACSVAGCIVGSPSVEERPLTRDSLLRLRDGPVSSLRALASKVIAGGYRRIQPSSTGGLCNAADADNWGSPLQPTGPCGSYFPAVWVDSALTINGLQGQGVLVVDGDLVVDGAFEFYGPVVVLGSLVTRGSGGHFLGGVVALSADLSQDALVGTVTIGYSSCAVDRAVRATSSVIPLRSRSWTILY